MKRSASATLRRTVRRAWTWRPKWPGREELSIETLISPLRYDVVVRAQFFGFLEENDTLDQAELLEAARLQPYRTWFELVAAQRFRPWTLRDNELLESQFDERVLRSLSMSRSFRDTGFDLGRPITLRWYGNAPVTDAGVPVATHLHVGDGGHRLALLLRTGGILAPGQYCIDPRRQPTVIDNTAILAPALELSEETYARFISAGFTDRRFDRVADLVRHVSEHDAQRLPELERMLVTHQRKVALSGA